MEIEKYVSPYWSAAELLRYAAVAFDTKRNSQGNVAKQLDEYVSLGYYQHEKHIRLIKEAIVDPAADVLALQGKQKDEFCRFLQTDIRAFFDDYHKAIGVLSGLGLSRRLMNKFVAGFVVQTFHHVIICHYKLIVGGGSAEKIFLKQTAIETVFSWLESTIPCAFTDFRALPEYDASSEAKWRAGKDIPRLSSLAKLVECIAPHCPNLQFGVAVCRGLLLARGIDFLLKDTIDSNLNGFLKSYHAKIDGERVLNEIREATMEVLHRFQSYTPLLKALTLPNVERAFTTDDFEAVYDEVYRYNAIQDRFGTFQALPMWLKGKFHLLCGDLKSARGYYKKAFEYSCYLGGDLPVEILQEAIVVAAVGKKPDRPFLKKLKNQGIALGLFRYLEVEQPDPHIGLKRSRAKDSIVEDWEIEQFKELFLYSFPPETFFDEGYIKKFKLPLPILINGEKFRTPDLKKPNKVIEVSDGRSKRFPQLVFYSMIDDLNAVKSLLDNKAELCSITKEGESALWFGLQQMNLAWFPIIQNPKSDLFDLLYEEAKRVGGAKNRDIVEVVNTPLLKKKITPLHCAIESGEPSVVHKILKLGAGVEQKTGLDQQTPLYLCLQTLFRRQFPEQFLEKRAFNMKFVPSEIIEDTKRRWAGPLPTHQDEEFEKNLEATTSEMLNQGYRRFDPEKLYKIIELLLQNGASPNTLCDFGSLKYFTPLMYVIEHDDLRLYNLFMKYGGDVTLQCYSLNNYTWYTCRDVAWRWGAKDILKVI